MSARTTISVREYLFVIALSQNRTFVSLYLANLKKLLAHSLITRLRGACLQNRVYLSLPELITRFASCAEQCRPVFQIGGKNLFHHAPCQFWNKAIQHHR